MVVNGCAHGKVEVVADDDSHHCDVEVEVHESDGDGAEADVGVADAEADPRWHLAVQAFSS